MDEFSVGDAFHIVGRVNNDGTVDAKMIKNESIWKTSTMGYVGVVTAVDIPGKNITIDWTPINYTPKFQLKEVLQEQNSSSVSAQTTENAAENTTATENTAGNTVEVEKVQKNKLRINLLKKIKEVVEKKVGQFVRAVKYKQVKIDRIEHPKVQLKNLIIRATVKKVRVDITDKTKIIIGTNENAAISDIRGTRHATLPLVTAETIVVVNSLPEIEENLETSIDDINEVVEVITTNESEDVATDTEQEIDVDSTAIE